MGHLEFFMLQNGPVKVATKDPPSSSFNIRKTLTPGRNGKIYDCMGEPDKYNTTNGFDPQNKMSSVVGTSIH
jgi:hypothetical protein